MVDFASAFGVGQRIWSAVTFLPAMQEFQQTKNFSSTLGFTNAITGVLGVEPVIHRMVRYTFELGQGIHNENLKAAQEMVGLMRSRAPVDTGRLVNGFNINDEGDDVVVTAEAVHPGADHNYARDVEFGRGGRAFADESFFATGDNAGAPLRRQSSGDGSMEAEPFFFNSAEETREHWGDRIRQLPSDL